MEIIHAIAKQSSVAVAMADDCRRFLLINYRRATTATAAVSGAAVRRSGQRRVQKFAKSLKHYSGDENTSLYILIKYCFLLFFLKKSSKRIYISKAWYKKKICKENLIIFKSIFFNEVRT